MLDLNVMNQEGVKFIGYSSKFHEVGHEFKIFKSLYIIHLKNVKVYTQNFIFSMISYPAQVIMFFYLWSAILSSTNLEGVLPEDLLAYYLLAFLIERLTANRIVTDNIEEEIVTGKMVTYFVRPISIYSIHLTEYISKLTINTLLMVPIAFILLEVLTPSFVMFSIWSIIFFAISILLAGISQFLMFFSIGLLAFWIERVWGIRMGFDWIISFFSGRLIPLYLFPIVLRNIVDLLPFRFFAYELIMIILNPISLNLILENIFFQTFWLIVLIVICIILLRSGSSKFIGYGV